MTLTTAKTNLGGEEMKSAFDASPVVINNSTEKTVLEPTQEEKDTVNRLIASLGL